MPMTAVESASHREYSNSEPAQPNQADSPIAHRKAESQKRRNIQSQKEYTVSSRIVRVDLISLICSYLTSAALTACSTNMARSGKYCSNVFPFASSAQSGLDQAVSPFTPSINRIDHRRSHATI